MLGAGHVSDRGLTGMIDGLSCPYISCLVHCGNRQWSGVGLETPLWTYCPALPYRSVPCVDLVRPAPRISSAGVLLWALCGKLLL